MTERSYGGGAWRGELHLVLLEDKTHASVRQGRQTWGLAEPLTYRTHAGDEITPPAGFVTDLASIPRPWTAFFVPSGSYTLAAVYHDYLYATRGTGVWHGHPRSISRARDYTRAEADQILLQAMQDLNVGPVTRFCIWAAVRIGGSAGWGS